MKLLPGCGGKKMHGDYEIVNSAQLGSGFFRFKVCGVWTFGLRDMPHIDVKLVLLILCFPFLRLVSGCSNSRLSCLSPLSLFFWLHAYTCDSSLFGSLPTTVGLVLPFISFFLPHYLTLLFPEKSPDEHRRKQKKRGRERQRAELGQLSVFSPHPLFFF